jgi:hypothetical protein
MARPDTTTPRMRVLAAYEVRARGPVYTVIYDAEGLPRAGSVLRRKADGRCWEIRGIERWAMNLLDWTGQPIGFLLERGAKLELGDEVEVLGSAA